MPLWAAVDWHGLPKGSKTAVGFVWAPRNCAARGEGLLGGARRVENLGMVIDTEDMKLYVSDGKVQKVRGLARKILLLAQRNRRIVSPELLRHFCGVCVSLSLAVPLARFYTRFIYFDMSLAERKERGPSPPAAPRAELARPRRCQEDLARSDAARSGAGQSNTVRISLGARVRDPQRIKVRLCRQSPRDIRYWRSLSRGEGRDLIRLEPHVAMHSDAADVGYGGTLGLDVGQGLPGLWEGRSFWSADDRAHSITLRELKAVRQLLHRHFASYISDPRVRRLLLHEDNQAVVYILNAMVSASRDMMVELRKLEVVLRVLGVRLEARWIPSAVNKFADTLSRTWNPGDVRATDVLLRSIQTEYPLSHVVFRERPLRDSLVARKKYLLTQREEDWRDGKRPFVESAVRPSPGDDTENCGGRWEGGVGGAEVARASLVRALARLELSVGGTAPRGRRYASGRTRREEDRKLVRRRRGDSIGEEWKTGIVTSLLARTGTDTATGGAEDAASLLAEYGWRERT